jgi:hypothetical protein
LGQTWDKVGAKLGQTWDKVGDFGWELEKKWDFVRIFKNFNSIK